MAGFAGFDWRVEPLRGVGGGVGEVNVSGTWVHGGGVVIGAITDMLFLSLIVAEYMYLICLI